jgi:hypothetical protein
LAQCESNLQRPRIVFLAQGVKPGLLLTVGTVTNYAKSSKMA